MNPIEQSESLHERSTPGYSDRSLLPRLIRLRDAPYFFGMDKNRFNREVRPFLTEIQIGRQGRAFDRLEMERAAEDYKTRNGRPAAQSNRRKPWETKERQASPNAAGSGTSTKCSEERAVRESTATSDVAKAQEQLARRIDQIRTATLYGLRSDHTFRAAATKFLEENQHKRSIGDDAMLLKQLDPFIGRFDAEAGAHRQPSAFHRQATEATGVKTRSINNALALVRHILNLAASEWRDDPGLTWLEYAQRSSCCRSRTDVNRTRFRARSRRCSFRSCPITSRAWRCSR